jgi:hypothetical protein
MLEMIQVLERQDGEDAAAKEPGLGQRRLPFWIVWDE